MGYKTADKEGKERGKRERERKIEMDSQKKVQILVFALAWKTKKLFYYVRLVGNMPFSLQNSFLATIMLICRKPVQRRGIGENAVFLLLTGRHKRVKLENNGCLGTGARTTLQKISKVDIAHIDVLPQSMICYMLHFLTKEINSYFTLKFINFFPGD